MRSVATFYKFVALADPASLIPQIALFCRESEALGTVHLACEGINATLVHDDRCSLEGLIGKFREIPAFADIDVKWSFANPDNEVFFRLKIEHRKSLVVSGVDQPDPQTGEGIKIDPRDWDALINDPNVVLLDVRNGYETEIGRFRGAVIPPILSYREFAPFLRERLSKDSGKQIAMYCTGGIRCEKTMSWMLEEGYRSVVQLDGGILKYLEIKQGESDTWEGECFVFDQRVSVNTNLEQGSYFQCHACRYPVSPADTRSPDYEFGVSCPKCVNVKSDGQKRGYRERVRQERVARARYSRHVGGQLPSASDAG